MLFEGGGGVAVEGRTTTKKITRNPQKQKMLVLVPPRTYLTGDCNFLASVACVYQQQTPTLADEMGGSAPSSILVLKCGYLWDDSPESDRYSEE